jgi:ribonuclease R
MGRKHSKKRKHDNQNNKTNGLVGKLDIAKSGMGFVIVDGMEEDIMVKPGLFNTALHGDTVEVQIQNIAGSMSRRVYGAITKIIKRKQTQFTGFINVEKHNGMFTADGDKPMPHLFVAHENLNGAKDGDRVTCKLIKWEQSGKRPEGIIMEVLKYEALNAQAMKQIVFENGFSLQFSEEAMEEAARLPVVIDAKEIKKRKDCRDILTFTIDPVDAKDFDDALSIKVIDKNTFEIGVHIADVSHYVQPNTILDEEAYERATSVYLPDRVNPMLPEEISNVLCSLRPKEDKLTFSAIFTITTKGAIKNVWLGRTVIHSNHRFTYEEVQEIIEGAPNEYKEPVLQLNTLAKIFRAERFTKGAINFSSIETRFVLDENGVPKGVTIKQSKESHQLIEEFMLLANKAVAEYIGKIIIKDKPLPFPYRIHDTPDEEKLIQFTAFAKKFGHKFDLYSPKGISESFNKMLQEAQGKPEQHVLEQLGIRTMAKAIYSMDNIGHYGLGFEHYCHFTSPIRRYPDVMVHRILQEVLDNNANVDKKMALKCKHCSERERAAMEAERAGHKYKQVEFMQQFIGQVFDGVISGVASFGFWVETVAHKCEGLVSMSSLLLMDDFRFEQTDYCLIGLRTGRKFRIGDAVEIKVVNTNLEKRTIDYVLNSVDSVDPFTNKDAKQLINKVQKGAKPSLRNNDKNKKSTDFKPKKKVATKTSSKAKPVKKK